MAAKAAPFRLGLTGGIGSGKSTVAGLLVQCGAVLIDADAISRGLTVSGGAAMPQIAAQFGAGLVGVDGALNRALMRERVFQDSSAKRQLEAIVHPLIAAQIAAQYAQALAQGQRLCVFDLPLLVESGARWRSQLDAVLVVDCAAATQIERVMRRDAQSLDAVRRVLGNQASRLDRLAAADAVVVNDGIDVPALAQRVRHCHTLLGLG
jgi:dephospho-CoA kinase